MKPHNKLMAFLMVCLFSIMMPGCTTVAANYGGVPRVHKSAMDYPPPETVVFKDQDFLFVQKKGVNYWWSYQKWSDGVMQRARGRGMPESEVQKSFAQAERDALFEQFLKEENSRYAFYGIGLVFNKSTSLVFTKGACKIELVSPSGAVEVVDDLGLLMKITTSGRKDYLDSGRSPIKVTWAVQEPDYSRVPNFVYLRLPKKYEGWRFKSLTVDSKRVAVATR